MPGLPVRCRQLNAVRTLRERQVPQPVKHARRVNAGRSSAREAAGQLLKKKGVVTLETIKILIAKSPKATMLLVGKDAEEELQGKFEGIEYQEFDIDAAYGIGALVDFCLKHEFKLGVQAGKSS